MGFRRKIAAVVVFLCWLVWGLSFVVSDSLKHSLAAVFDVSGCSPKMAVAQSENNPDILRVCTWNVHNYSVSRRSTSRGWREAPKPEPEKSALCQEIKRINPDVLLLNEMGDSSFLEEFRLLLEKSGTFFPYAVTTKRDAPVRLAILSKISPSKIVDFSRIDFVFNGECRHSPRGALGLEFTFDNVKIRVFSVHLKSKFGAKKIDENFTPFRYAEIRAIDARIKSLEPSNLPVFIAGDFNDEPSDSLLRNFVNSNITLVPFDSDSKPYSYVWAKKNRFYLYDFFLANESALNMVSTPAKIGNSDGASDHKPVYIDISIRSRKDGKSATPLAKGTPTI